MATILVIEDDGPVRRLARRFLEEDGHTVLEAGDGRAAMRVLEGAAPDLIVTDIMMPERDGLETIREIRATDRAVPVLAVSGGGWSGDMNFLDAAAEFGADRTLRKPYQGRLLVETVNQMLRERGRPT